VSSSAPQSLAPPVSAIIGVVGEPELRDREVDAADRRLAQRLAAGERGALDDVYERYGGACFGFLLRALEDRGAAEDVQQQVFLEVWQRAPRYDPDRAGLLTWIMVIARSRAIDHLRRKVPEPAGTVADAHANVAFDEIGELAERWRMAGLLARLPPQEAMVLRMRFYEELTQREIADRTGLPLGTVKMRMVNALDRLRELMEDGR
jgi:RNA polymerase sigma-70 factor (ECF subfamily)